MRKYRRPLRTGHSPSFAEPVVIYGRGTGLYTLQETHRNALGTRRRPPTASPCLFPLEALPIHPTVVVVVHDLPSELARYGFLRRLPLPDRPALGHAVEPGFDESRRLGEGREAARAPKDDIAALGEGGEGGLIEGSGLGEGCESGLGEGSRLGEGGEARCGEFTGLGQGGERSGGLEGPGLGKGGEARLLERPRLCERGERCRLQRTGLGKRRESALLESARLRKGRERGRCEGPALGQRREGTLAPDRNRS